MIRPGINDINSGEEFKLWYWLKAEVVDYCKTAGMSYSGSKLAIIDRIADALDGRSAQQKPTKTRASSFKWSTSTLTLATLITDSYTNGPNTRKFFKIHCGDQFHFSILFMDWMKNNRGKTLGDAVDEWQRQDAIRKKKNFKSVIPGSNQYNQYIRDFFLDNPGKSMTDARRCWKLKRSLPGLHTYAPGDLSLKEG